MKGIELHSLDIKNFRGIKSLTVTPWSAPTVTVISGRNATGKTSTMNAYLWLLWGYDIEGKKDYNIKPTDLDGKPVQMVDTEVTAELKEIGSDDATKLGRKYIANFVKPKGQAEEVFKGYTTEYYINDVPVKMSEYNAEVERLGGDRLRHLTTPEAFLTQDWKKMRAELVAISGVDEEKIKKDHQSLFDNLKSGKTLEQYAAELKASKKKLQKDLSEVQPRIDQTESVKPEAEDWEALESEIKAVEDKLGGFEAQIHAGEKATSELLKAEKAKRDRLTEIAKQKSAIIEAARSEEVEAQARTRRRRSNAEIDLEEATKLKERTEKILKYDAGRRALLEAELKERTEAREKEAEEWKKAKREAFTEDLSMCPTCGQPLPPDKVREARERFEKTKAFKLEAIQRRGQILKSRIDEITDDLAEFDKSEAKYTEDIRKLSLNIGILTEKIKNEQRADDETVGAGKKPVTPAEERPEYRALIEEEKALLEALKTSTAKDDEATARAKEERAEALKERDELKKRLAVRDNISALDATIKALETKGRQLSQEVATIEMKEAEIADYTKAYMTAVEESVNGMFTSVSFRLFDYTLDGNPVEVCVPLIGGKTYHTASTAERINAGVEVIEALQRAYGFSAPTWVDGTESVNAPRVKELGQTIVLEVTNEPFNISTK